MATMKRKSQRLQPQDVKVLFRRAAPGQYRWRHWMVRKLDNRRGSHENGWSVQHMDSGAVAMCWSLKECRALIRFIATAPTSAATVRRWYVMRHPDGSQVLIDRVSGRWWKRVVGSEVTRAELEYLTVAAVRCSDVAINGDVR